MERILITGAAGKIGDALRKGLRGSYRSSAPRHRPARNGQGRRGNSFADIRDVAAMEKSMKGIDCVVHLAGASEEAEWEKVLPLNIEGCYNIFEPRAVKASNASSFASSNHASVFHRRETFIDNTVAPRPDSRYGVSKVFGRSGGPPLCRQAWLKRCVPPYRHLPNA